MLADVRAVAWKELRELLAQGGGSRGGRWSTLLVLAIPVIVLPSQIGEAWLTSTRALLFAQWIPLFLVIGVVADSFAGERERHTLETLLSTRLPDRAILFGKVLVAVAYGWAITAAVMLLSAVTTNLFYRDGGVHFYRPVVLVGTLLLNPVICGLIAGIGVLISLRAPTVRQAQLILSFILMFVIAGPGLVVARLTRFTDWLSGTFSGVGLAGALFLGGLALLLVDAAVLALAVGRFQRSRLILD